MHCDYFEAGVCRSCTEIRIDYVTQLASKDREARDGLADLGQRAAGCRWLPPVASAVLGFRNRAKMVAGGTVESPLLGILGPDLRGVDLTACLLCAPEIRASFPAIVAMIRRAKIPPYDVASRRGELKYVLVTVGDAGSLLVRFVLRTDEAVPRIRKHLAWFEGELPAARVVSANLQPEPSAIVEGTVEVLLTEERLLPMRLGRLPALGAVGAAPILLPPGAFFQTNTQVATELYAIAAEWVAELHPAGVLDLFCGVGGFALHAARALAAGPERGHAGGQAAVAPFVGHDQASVRGVELQPAAVEAATESAALWGLDNVRFAQGDATETACAFPELVIVNPPRRGIGDRLCAVLEASTTRSVLYSSCNLASLRADLAGLSSFRLARAVVLDMFPHTRHFEILTLLVR